MNKEDLMCLIGKYLNGYKIVKVKEDPFIKGQINLFTDSKTERFPDRYLVKFYVRNEGNTSKIYQELVDKENYELKQALNAIREYFNTSRFSSQFENNGNEENVRLDILQIINKVLGDNEK